MLASPIINPVVILATIYSFGATIPSMIIYRSLAGILIAIAVGIGMSAITKKDEVFKSNNKEELEHEDLCGCEYCDTESVEIGNKKIGVRFLRILNHTKEEFLDIIKYLIVGALIATLAQLFIPRNLLLELNTNKPLEIAILMLFAYLISLCSTADSFVAKTFVNQITNNSILAFLLLGPMIDIKNTLVLAQNYNKKFVLKLILLIFILVFAVSLVAVI
ncbi:putative permease [compost metagenome]